jgi:tetraprenyl-beta-curcumene synthase
MGKRSHRRQYLGPLSPYAWGVTAALREVAGVCRALVVYRTRVVPVARAMLRGWRRRAAEIDDPALRELALAAIDEKGLNVEATAVFATLAPWRQRSRSLRAMVALQVAVDYLDSLDEHGKDGDPQYLQRLFADFRTEAHRLPAAAAIEVVLERAVSRCGEGQRHTHHAERGDRPALESWARAQVAPPVYRWWEVAAGASSSVAAHALIAAAADRRTSTADAELVDAAYFPPLGALTVFLDDLVDHDQDAAAGGHDYLAYYRDGEEAAERLELISELGRAAIARLRQPRRHAAILAGVVGFYLSTPEADTPHAAPLRDRLLAASGPAVPPVVAFMRRRRRPEA